MDLHCFHVQVVPLSKKSGLMEWCEGTMPLGNYLIGSRTAPGAHQRYHPNDWTARDCRKKLSVSKELCRVTYFCSTRIFLSKMFLQRFS